ncbi:MAG: hypothetical protein K2L68_05945, partial [Muribaculaceae bacterium]|nr:hypothetical protein [Muribaculaceae bacterium]
MKNIARYILPLTLAGMIPLGACKSMMTKGNNDNNVEKEAVLPTDREKIVQPVSAVYTSEELSNGILTVYYTNI